MLVELEDMPAIGALALEHTAAIMESMAEHMNPRVTPGNETTVEPDHSVAIIERNQGHMSVSPNPLPDFGKDYIT